MIEHIRHRPWLIAAAVVVSLLVVFAARIGAGQPKASASAGGTTTADERSPSATSDATEPARQRTETQRSTTAADADTADAGDGEKLRVERRSGSTGTAAEGADDAVAASVDGSGAGPRAGKRRIGEGIHQVGVAVRPGIYGSGGGDACRWSRLSSKSSEDVVETSVGAGPQTVLLTSREWFETSGCDTWYRQR